MVTSMLHWEQSESVRDDSESELGGAGLLSSYQNESFSLKFEKCKANYSYNIIDIKKGISLSKKTLLLPAWMSQPIVRFSVLAESNKVKILIPILSNGFVGILNNFYFVVIVCFDLEPLCVTACRREQTGAAGRQENRQQNRRRGGGDLPRLSLNSSFICLINLRDGML